MRNITTEIQKAINTDVTWRVNELYLFLELTQKEQITASFEDGVENWAGIGLNNANIGWVWCKSPLIFITSNVANLFVGILNQCPYIIPVVVSSLASEELLIDYDQELVDRLGPDLYNKPVSVSDIWFNSIT